MINILNTIENTFNKALDEYMNAIADEFGIDKSKLSDVWQKLHGNVKEETKSKPKKTVVKNTEIDDEIGEKEDLCLYKFIKGKNEGTTCSVKAKKGSKYCSKHQKFEDSGQKEKKIVPKVVDGNKSPERTLRMNKTLNKWWHQDSGLVFKSKDEKVVIGVFNDDKIEDLKEEDIKKCEKYSFKYEVKDKKIIKKKTNEDLTDNINNTNEYAKDIEDLLKDMIDEDLDEEE